jgi:predicted dehydrogenase
MGDRIKVGVVGCGYWGPNLARNFRANAGCELKLVCDRDQDRLTRMKSLYPEVEAHQEYEYLLNGAGVDAVAIATPVHLHHTLAKQALLAGKHAFIEKPMASTSAECLDLIQLAEERGLTLMTGHTFIYSQPVTMMKDIIDSGEIGDILYIASRRLNLGLFQKDINVAWDLAPHDLSIILYLMGRSPSSVNCQGQAHVHPNIEDVTNMSLDFDGEGFATVHSSWLDPKKVREMTVVGTKKMIHYDDNEPLEKLKIYDKRVEVPPHYDTFAEFQYSYHYGDMCCPYIKHSEPLGVETSHFLDCIRTGETPRTSGHDGLEMIRILEASSASLAQGGAKIDLS